MGEVQRPADSETEPLGHEDAAVFPVAVEDPAEPVLVVGTGRLSALAEVDRRDHDDDDQGDQDGRKPVRRRGNIVEADCAS